MFLATNLISKVAKSWHKCGISLSKLYHCSWLARTHLSTVISFKVWSSCFFNRKCQILPLLKLSHPSKSVVCVNLNGSQMKRASILDLATGFGFVMISSLQRFDKVWLSLFLRIKHQSQVWVALNSFCSVLYLAKLCRITISFTFKLQTPVKF